jgi:hypothetical protein
VLRAVLNLPMPAVGEWLLAVKLGRYCSLYPRGFEDAVIWR